MVVTRRAAASACERLPAVKPARHGTKSTRRAARRGAPSPLDAGCLDTRRKPLLTRGGELTDCALLLPTPGNGCSVSRRPPDCVALDALQTRASACTLALSLVPLRPIRAHASGAVAVEIPRPPPSRPWHLFGHRARRRSSLVLHAHRAALVAATHRWKGVTAARRGPSNPCVAAATKIHKKLLQLDTAAKQNK